MYPKIVFDLYCLSVLPISPHQISITHVSSWHPTLLKTLEVNNSRHLHQRYFSLYLSLTEILIGNSRFSMIWSNFVVLMLFSFNLNQILASLVLIADHGNSFNFIIWPNFLGDTKTYLCVSLFVDKRLTPLSHTCS